MNKIKTFTLAGLIGLIALAGGTFNQAAAQGDDLLIGGRTTFDSAAMPTDQNAGFVKEAYGDALGRKAGDGENNALIGLLKPADQKSITDGTSSADQRGGYVQGAYGDVLGRKAGDEAAKGSLAKVGTGHLILPSQNTYGGLTTVNEGVLSHKGSLSRVGSIGDLFANSKGGDQGNGLLLPAVRGGGTQQAHGAGGGGGAGKVHFEDISIKPEAPKGLTAAHGAGGGGGAGKTVDSKAINFTNNPNAGGGPHVAPGAAKGINFTNTAKK